MSRSMQGEKRIHARPNRNCLAPEMPIGPWLAATISPPERRCFVIEVGKRFLCLGIERGGRLVQQPERALHRGKPRDRQPPPLAGRQVRRGQIGQARRGPTALSARSHVRLAAQIGAPERQVLGDAKRALHRRPGVRGNAPARRCCDSALPPSRRQSPAGEPHQPGDDSQQGGLAGAVPPGDEQGLAFIDRETQTRENLAAAALAGDVFGDQPHQPARHMSGKSANLMHVNPAGGDMASAEKSSYKPATNATCPHFLSAFTHHLAAVAIIR